MWLTLSASRFISEFRIITIRNSIITINIEFVRLRRPFKKFTFLREFRFACTLRADGCGCVQVDVDVAVGSGCVCVYVCMYVCGHGAFEYGNLMRSMPNLSGQVQRVHRKFVCCALICAFVFSWSAAAAASLPHSPPPPPAVRSSSSAVINFVIVVAVVVVVLFLRSCIVVL